MKSSHMIQLALNAMVLHSISCVTTTSTFHRQPQHHLHHQPRANFFRTRALWSEPTLDFPGPDEVVKQASESAPPPASTTLDTNLETNPNLSQTFHHLTPPSLHLQPSSQPSSSPAVAVASSQQLGSHTAGEDNVQLDIDDDDEDEKTALLSGALDEKTFLELFTAANFSSLPLSSDKLLWFASHDQFKHQPVSSEISPSTASSATASSVVSAAAESIKNDVTVSTKYLKTVSLCDKTLAITDFISDEDSVTPHLIKCELFDLEKNPERAYAEVQRTGLQIQTIEFSKMRDIINSCRQIAEIGTEISSPIGLAEESLPQSINTTVTTQTQSLWNFWRALLPGTKWCGLGDSAKNYYDLGKRKEVDICCRAHDHCPIRLKALRMGYGLINLSLYTKSHCECDEDFARCLRQVNNKVSEMLGNFYFNIMRMQCIKEEKTVICKEFRKSPSTGKEECIRYEEDKNLTKMIFQQPEISYNQVTVI